MENTSIVKTSGQIIQSVDDLSRIGKMMAVSGYFTDARDAAQASVKIMAGMEMGFGAFASMTGIYIISGKPSVGANLMASAVKANPKYDYRVREHNNNVCKIEFFERVDGKWDSVGVSDFSIEDARKAGVKNLDKFARNMLFARAMSNGIRWFCPDVFAGNPTYTPEELGAVVDDEGNVTELPKAQKAAQNAPETPVIVEGEATPITAPSDAEKPVEAQEKPKFDAVSFLRNWSHKAGLPPMTLVEASQVKNRDGVEYGKLETAQLCVMWIGLSKKMKTEQDAEKRDQMLFKMSALNEILTAKASAQSTLDAIPDPFIKQ